MEKVRIRELAKELGMKSSKEILLFLERAGQKGKSASSNIEGDLIEKVRSHFRKGSPPPPVETPLEVTHEDGSLERKSRRVVLRRSAPEPEVPAEPPPASIASRDEASIDIAPPFGCFSNGRTTPSASTITTRPTRNSTKYRKYLIRRRMDDGVLSLLQCQNDWPRPT